VPRPRAIARAHDFHSKRFELQEFTMPPRFPWILLLLVLTGCAGQQSTAEEDPEMPLDLHGIYRGRYWVTHEDGTSQQRRMDGPVWMRFEDGSYEIQGEYEFVPPAGGGEYTLEGRVLVLDDTFMHTANFDWSLILKGRFDIDVGGEGRLRLTQRDMDHARYHELELVYEGPPSSNR